MDADGYGFASDCQEDNPNVNPGVSEVPYDQVDNDCDPSTRDDDVDGDGFGQDTDCDDTNPAVNPNANEVTYDGIDNDCDATTLDSDLDQDGVGFGDCNDRDASVYPGATEVPYDGVDNDCDPSTRDDDIDGDGFPNAVDCDDNEADINPSAVEVIYDGIDNDCRAATLDDDLDQDGFALADDCDDDNADANPNADEVFYNGVDEACDEGDDYDQDGDGRQAYGVGVDGDDCDDNDANISDCGRSPETALPTCMDIATIAPTLGDGEYWIDPDGSNPTLVSCDMTTDGGGWTVIEYVNDLPFIQQFSGGDRYQYLADDFELALTDSQVDALRTASTEARQTYVADCHHVIHYRYQEANFAYAAGFRFHDGTDSVSATSEYGDTITVTSDACQPNDYVDRQTIFEIRTLSLPVMNIYTRDSADANERFGSRLTNHPVRMR